MREILDIDEASCPREIYGVDVSDDPIFAANKSKEEMILMPVYRTKYDKGTGKYAGNPRKQVSITFHISVNCMQSVIVIL